MLSCSEQIVLLVLQVQLLLLSLSSMMRLLADEVVLSPLAILMSLSSMMRLLADEVLLSPLAILMSSEASLIERMRLKKSHLKSTSLSREMCVGPRKARVSSVGLCSIRFGTSCSLLFYAKVFTQ